MVEAQRRVPVAVARGRRPAPVGRVLEHQPGRHAERAGEVRDHRVDRDDEGAVGDQARGGGEVERAAGGVQYRQRARPGQQRQARARAAQGRQQRGGHVARRIPIARRRAQPDRPPRQGGRGRREVGRRRVRGRGAERVRQLHDLDLGAGPARRLRGIEGDQPCFADERREQRMEPRARLHRHSRGAAREERQEARELDRVAQPLVAAHQYVAAVERAPVPQPAVMVGQRRVVARGRIARRDHRVADRPCLGIAPRAHCLGPASGRFVHRRR